MKKYVIIGVLFVIINILVVTALIWRYQPASILIAYHNMRYKHEMRSLSKLHRSPSTSPSQIDAGLSEMKRHSQELIRLGFFENRTFPTTYIKPNSPQFTKMNAEFQKRFPGAATTCGFGADTITITDEFDKMPVWEELIKKHDVP